MELKKQPIFLFIIVIVSICFGGVAVKFFSKIKSGLISQVTEWDNIESFKWSNEFQLVEISSSKDNSLQYAYFSAATDSKLKKPLLVSLHTWSASYSQEDPLAIMAHKHGWNYIHPDFRGPNWSKQACLSELAISDIDDAIQYVINNSNVDIENIFIVGVSGGGYATLGSYLKTRHKINAFLSWVPMSDLTAWYYQSKSINIHSKYAKDIFKCTSEKQMFDEKSANNRSPIFWEIPEHPNGKLEIFAGINDGHEGSVPISHSILFFNRLVSSMGFLESRVGEADIVKLLTRSIEKNKYSKIGDRNVFYKSVTPLVSLTIFDGGHEMLANYCFNRLIQLSEERKIQE